jgi:hypothetical protein
VRTYAPRTRDIETTDSELRLVATLRRVARVRDGGLAVDGRGGVLALATIQSGSSRRDTGRKSPSHPTALANGARNGVHARLFQLPANHAMVTVCVSGGGK